jgi:hypothetical protein
VAATGARESNRSTLPEGTSNSSIALVVVGVVEEEDKKKRTCTLVCGENTAIPRREGRGEGEVVVVRGGSSPHVVVFVEWYSTRSFSARCAIAWSAGLARTDHSAGACASPSTTALRHRSSRSPGGSSRTSAAPWRASASATSSGGAEREKLFGFPFGSSGSIILNAQIIIIRIREVFSTAVTEKKREETKASSS